MTVHQINKTIAFSKYQQILIEKSFHNLELKVKVKLLSPVRLFMTPWTVAYQTPSSMRFSRQEYWRGLPFPSPGDLRKPEMESRSPTF